MSACHVSSCVCLLVFLLQPTFMPKGLPSAHMETYDKTHKTSPSWVPRRDVKLVRVSCVCTCLYTCVCVFAALAQGKDSFGSSLLVRIEATETWACVLNGPQPAPHPVDLCFTNNTATAKLLLLIIHTLSAAALHHCNNPCLLVLRPVHISPHSLQSCRAARMARCSSLMMGGWSCATGPWALWLASLTTSQKTTCSWRRMAQSLWTACAPCAARPASARSRSRSSSWCSGPTGSRCDVDLVGLGLATYLPCHRELP